jgi:AcrR family transcriptional regulator
MNEDHQKQKSQRVRSLFAETAKRMILEQGFKTVSVRKVATEAGYTYASVYNHFSSFDELLWLTRNLIITDISQYLREQSPNEVKNLEDLIQVFIAYALFFMERPNFYEFMFFVPLDKKEKSETSLVEQAEFQEGFMKTYAFLASLGTYSPEEVQKTVQIIIYAMQGILTLAISENDDLSKDKIDDEVRSIIEFLFRDLD